MTAEEAAMIMIAGSGNSAGNSANINLLMATKNDTYTASGDTAGYSPVAVLSAGNCGNLIGAYICNLFEAQPPLIKGTIFGNYTFKVCIMPIRKYSAALITAAGIYCGSELLYISELKTWSFYEIDATTWNTSDAVISATYSSSDSVNIYYLKYGYTVLYVPSFTVNVYGITVKAKGYKTSKWATKPVNFSFRLIETGETWRYTRFNGNELIAKSKQISDDLRQT